MVIKLSEIEVRVMGVLMEKQITVPDSYPMSPNGIRLGCNQKNSRFPLTEYTDRDVDAAISTLRDKRLVTVVHEHGARVPKYAQVLTRELKFEMPHHAIMAVLMLRGAQTPGELRGRAEPIFRFDSLEHAEKTIQDLCDWIPDPVMVQLERQPGESAIRFAHLLGDIEAQRAAPSGPVAAYASAGPNTNERLEALEREVKELRAELQEIKSSLGI